MLLPSNYRRCQGGLLPGKERAFTLVELLVVVGIMSLLMMLALPAFNAISGAGSLTKGASDFQGFLEQARSLAMSQNTYVYVGVQEVDSITPTTNNGIGRVVVAAVASLNGTRPYTSIPVNLATNSTNITQLSKALYFDNIHITNVGSVTNPSPNMTNRPSGASVVDFSATPTNCISFTWPIGTTNTKYYFRQVIEFDPQGVPRVQTNTAYSPSIQNYIEIPLVITHGDLPVANSLNQAAIQLDGITGAVIVYRP